MKQSPQVLAAAAAPAADLPQLQLDKLYELRLPKQSDVKFVIAPARAAASDDARAGLVQFRSSAAGRYRPHKVVEFDLPANRSLTLQLSRAQDAVVAITVTRASR